MVRYQCNSLILRYYIVSCGDFGLVNHVIYVYNKYGLCQTCFNDLRLVILFRAYYFEVWEVLLHSFKENQMLVVFGW